MSAAPGERTEKATSRRRRRAKDQGQFAYSQELTSAITTGVCVAAVFYFLHSPVGFRAFFEGLLETVVTADHPEEVLVSTVRHAGLYFLAIAGPFFGAAVIAALAGNFLQGLPVFAPEAAALKWERLSPMSGLSRLKTQASWIQWLKLILLVGAVGLVAWNSLSSYWEQLVTLPARSIDSSTTILRSVTQHLVTYAMAAVAILAAADFFIQRWRFEKSIKQTKAEVKDDMKAVEGNPAVKGKIRLMQRDRARGRMMSRMKEADVIVTNLTHYAVALEYKPGKMAAPRVIAKGKNWLAEKIEVGRESDIPTVENVLLARALYRSVELEEEIPIDLYKEVADVLASVHRTRKQL